MVLGVFSLALPFVVTGRRAEFAAMFQHHNVVSTFGTRNQTHKGNLHHSKKEGGHAISKGILNSMDTVVSQLERQATTGPLPQEEIDMVHGIMDSLDEDFVPVLERESEMDSSNYATKTLTHERCTMDKDKRLHGSTGDVTVAKFDVTSARQKHSACRKAESSLASYQSLAQEIVEGSWMTIAKSDSVSAHADICAQRSTFTNDLDVYKAIAPDTISNSCEIDQEDFESNQCDWLVAKLRTCRAFDECIIEVDLAGYKSEIEERVRTREAVFLAIQNLKCRLQHLIDVFSGPGDASNSSSVSNCSSILVRTEDEDKFSLVLDVPDVVACSNNPDISSHMLQPSLADSSTCLAWTTEEYSWNSTRTVVSQCTRTCHLPDATIGKTVVAGCIDGPETDCSFYQRHSDACGGYDDETFSASTSCCACGGGATTTSTTPSTSTSTSTTTSTSTSTSTSTTTAAPTIAGKQKPAVSVTPSFLTEATDPNACAGILASTKAHLSFQWSPIYRTSSCDDPVKGGGWEKVLEFQDDWCGDDYPDTVDEIKAGFARSNSAFIGQAQLHDSVENSAYSKVLMCFRASRSQCTTGCAVLSASNWQADMDVGDCSEFSSASKLERIVLGLSGSCQSNMTSGWTTDGETMFTVGTGSTDVPPVLTKDGKDVARCDWKEAPVNVYRLMYGVNAWHTMGSGVSLQIQSSTNGFLDDAGFYELGRCMQHCSDFAAEAMVDSMYLYLGTSESTAVWDTDIEPLAAV